MPEPFKPLCEDYGCYRGDEVDALRRERDKARAEVELLRAERDRLREAFDAMVLWDGRWPRYRTAGDVPQHMPKKVQRVVQRLADTGERS